MSDQRIKIAIAAAVLLALNAILANESATAAGGANPEQSNGSAIGVREIELRGHVVCLAEEMSRAYQADLPTNHEHLWGFKTTDNRYFTLLRGKLSEGIFVDERLRAKELIIKGRAFPGSSILETTHLRSVKDGKVHEIYYYCEICAIKTLYPGECMCCQGPVDLIEKPAEEEANE